MMHLLQKDTGKKICLIFLDVESPVRLKIDTVPDDYLTLTPLYPLVSVNCTVTTK